MVHRLKYFPFSDLPRRYRSLEVTVVRDLLPPCQHLVIILLNTVHWLNTLKLNMTIDKVTKNLYIRIFDVCL